MCMLSLADVFHVCFMTSFLGRERGQRRISHETRQKCQTIGEKTVRSANSGGSLLNWWAAPGITWRLPLHCCLVRRWACWNWIVGIRVPENDGKCVNRTILELVVRICFIVSIPAKRREKKRMKRFHNDPLPPRSHWLAADVSEVATKMCQHCCSLRVYYTVEVWPISSTKPRWLLEFESLESVEHELRNYVTNPTGIYWRSHHLQSQKRHQDN